MTIEKIFEKVRKEEAVFWIGSGFSKYAGYPTGAEFAKLLYEKLNKTEQSLISFTDNLPQLSEEFVRIKNGSKNELNSIIKQTFQKKPSTIKWHEVVSKIPHIKTIITTNYDNLFENAYGNEAIKIVRNQDVAYLNGKTEIFKIHGDLGILESIIITASDYGNFFYEKTDSNLLWNVVTERITNKSIVFIGYSLEDSNVFNVIKKVKETLKENRKEVFLVAPNLPQHKANSLIQNEIQYVNLKGEVFIEKLYKNIKENITSDFDKGFVSPDTLRKFFFKNELKVELEAMEERFRLKSVKGIDGTFEGLLSISLKKDTPVFKKFTSFINGTQFGEIEIDGKSLNNLGFSAKEINLLTGDKNDFKLILTSKPSFSGKIDIEFENGFEITDVRCTLFTSKELTEIIIVYKNVELKVAIDNKINKDSTTEINEVRLNFKQKDKFRKTSDGLIIFNFLKHLISGEKFYVHIQDGPNNRVLNFQFNKQITFADEIDMKVEYFDLLKKIESAYGIFFYDIEELTEDYFNSMNLAVDALNNNKHDVEWDKELVFDLDNPNSSLELLLKMEENGTSFMAENTQKEEVEIYGQTISIGYKKIEFLEPFIVNKDELFQKKEKKAIVKSKIEKVRISYSQNSISQTPVVKAQ